MAFVLMKVCAGFVKRTQNTTLKIHHTRMNSYKGARLYNCAAVAICISATCKLSLVNH